jgi:hypothetical protein
MSAPPRSLHLIGLYLWSLRCKACSLVPKTVRSIVFRFIFLSISLLLILSKSLHRQVFAAVLLLIFAIVPDLIRVVFPANALEFFAGGFWFLPLLIRYIYWQSFWHIDNLSLALWHYFLLSSLQRLSRLNPIFLLLLGVYWWDTYFWVSSAGNERINRLFSALGLYILIFRA